MGGVMRVLRSTRPNVVCFQEVTQRACEVLQRARTWYALGLRAATPLPPGCYYGALILAALPVLYAGRAPFPSTSQGRDFVEARVLSPWGSEVSVSTLRIESTSGRDIGTARADQLRLAVGWLQSEGQRICAGGFN